MSYQKCSKNFQMKKYGKKANINCIAVISSSVDIWRWGIFEIEI